MKRLIEKFAEKGKENSSRKKLILTFVWGTILHWGIIPPLLVIVFRRADHYLPSLSILPPYNYVLSLGFFILGIIWTIASIIDQWKIGEGTFITASYPTKKLVKQESYHYTRNPMYLGYIFLLAGAGFLFNSIGIIFGLIPIVFLFLLFYSRFFEEKVLTAKFGEEYEEYKNETPFLFPVPVRSIGIRIPKEIKFSLSILLVIGIISSIYAGYNSFSVKSQKFGKIIWHGPRTEKTVALTFDDGPNPPYTNRILDILKKYNVKATFFLIGFHVDQYPELVKREVEEGHAIGNHTYSHSTLVFDKHKKIVEEISRCENSIKKASGIRPYIIRLPRDWREPEIFQVTEERGYSVISMSIRTFDWAQPGAKKIVKRILKRLKPGDIIEMHDGDGDHLIYQHSREQTVKALPIIIKEIKKRGYSFVTIPEMLSEKE